MYQETFYQCRTKNAKCFLKGVYLQRVMLLQEVLQQDRNLSFTSQSESYLIRQVGLENTYERMTFLTQAKLFFIHFLYSIR